MMKIGLTKTLFVTALAITLGAASAVQANELERQARMNDAASKYVLTKDHTLYRVVRGKRCDITTDVESFKISQHPKDRAMVYFKKNGDLYMLANDGPTYWGCPKASTKVLMENVKKYSVTSDTQTEIVSVALSKYGLFRAWDNINPVYDVLGADDYQMNQNFGADGKPFSSYVTFVHSARGGYIMKIKGIHPEKSKWDTRKYYSSIADFKAANDLDRADLE